jgi:hypothetical protein
MNSVKKPTPYTNSRAVYGMVIDVGSPRISLSTPSTERAWTTYPRPLKRR